MENYELQCGLRGNQSSRAMDAYVWAIKTEESYNKVNMRHKEAGKAEREAQLLREKKKKEKKEIEKNEKTIKKNIVDKIMNN